MKEEEKIHDGGQEGNHGKDMVTIYVNDKGVPIHRGSQTVAEIKVAGGVPSTDILYLMPNYEVELVNTESITIKGDERFKSSAPSGGSS